MIDTRKTRYAFVIGVAAAVSAILADMYIRPILDRVVR